jgi:hypothetical protein
MAGLKVLLRFPGSEPDLRVKLIDVETDDTYYARFSRHVDPDLRGRWITSWYWAVYADQKS